MFSGRGFGSDPRLEKYERAVTGDLNRWIAKHYLLTPAIGSAITGALFAVSHFTGMVILSRLGIMTAIITLFLLFYGLTRKVVTITRKEKENSADEETPAGMRVQPDEMARRAAVSRWKARTWQERNRQEPEE
ncbi:MAG TPA: hypothetical protein G4O07_01585 [Dehalococcoidia bacterium]|nr:hypothetical protein [Dehalococcoidia bacterium]